MPIIAKSWIRASICAASIFFIVNIRISSNRKAEQGYCC
jgi:hypothetical protein